MAAPATLTYGADDAGLICGYLFEPEIGTRAIDSTEAAARLASLRTDDDSSDGLPHAGPFLWLHFDLSHTAAEPWLSRHADLADTWRLAAYGRRPVAVARVEELVAGWDSHFGQAPARP